MVWYTLADEETLLDNAASGNRVAVDVLGQSVGGRDIRRVRIGDPPPGVSDRTLLLTGCVHGEEAAGRQALLNLVRDFSNAGPYLTLTGTSGDYASTPDAAALRITGDLSLRAEVAVDDWDNGLQALVGRYEFTTDDRSYRITTNSSGGMRLYWSTDGASFETVDSTDALPSTDGERLALRADLDVDNGSSGHDVRFFTAPSLNGPWTQLGATVTTAGTTSVFAGTADLEVGSSDDGSGNLWPGRVFAAQVWDGSTLVADLDFQQQDLGSTGFVDDTGLTWTVHGSAAVASTLTADELGFLADWGIVILPTVNPDGFAAETRTNANTVDINRDFMALSQPESRLVAQAIGQMRPILHVDHHESVNIIEPGNDIEVNAARPAQAHELMWDNGVTLRDLMLARATTEGWPNDVFGSTFRGDIRILDISSPLRHCAACIVETNFSDDTTSGREHRLEMHEAMVEEIVAYAVSNMNQLLEDADTAETDKTTEGEQGTQPFDLRGGTILDPPPLAYDLTQAQIETVTLHLAAYNITVEDGSNRVLMGQYAQPVIPYLLDGASQYTIVSASRVFELTPGDEVEPVPEVGVAQIRTRMTWLGCDLVSGRVIAQLHDITGPVSRLIGSYTQSQLTLPIPLDTTGRAPLATVVQATQPAEVMIVAVVNDLPIWAGIPLPRERGTEATMPLGCITLEGYLDRRYVGDHDLEDVDEALIAAALVDDAQVEGIGLTLDTPPTGRLRTRHYRDHDDATVYQRLRELSQVQDGPEWTIDLDWTGGDENVIRKIFRVRSRLGAAADAPDAVFRTTASSVFGSQSGSEARYRFREDYTDGRYANHVLPVGSGEGEDRVQGSAARDEDALDAGKARWEMRIRPSTSITDVDLLNEHGQAELERRKHGAQTWRIIARWSAYPRYGVDWRLGDDLAWHLVGHGHPDPGVRGQGRGIGFELDPQAGTLAPILLDPTSNGG